MITIQNVSPLGALEVPLLRRTLDAGETIDVTPEHAERLLAQPTNFAQVGSASVTIADLKTQLEAAGLPTNGKKADLEARLEQHHDDAAAAAAGTGAGDGPSTGDIE